MSVYSLVIPLKNEEENIVPLINEIIPVMNALEHPWELICIDDGSTDKTRSILEGLSKDLKFLRLISFDKNYGQSSAFDVGFRSATGEFIITLDGDGQNDPKDIPKLLAHAHHADLICGIRALRKDTWIKKITSKIANFVRQKICEDKALDTGCSLKIYRRSCLEKIKLYEGLHRFLPALFDIEGFTLIQVPVNHRERWRGKSHYNFLNRSFNTIADMLAVRWMRKRQLRYRKKSQ